MTKLNFSCKTSLRGKISVPGDKSISHRAVILGSLAKGITRIHGFLAGEDCLNTAGVFQRMGVSISREGPEELVISGAGLSSLKEPMDLLDVGNSGTSIRLISGVLAGQPFYSVITGDDSIRQRPMKRVTEPLREMGATIFGREGGNKAPLTILGGDLVPIDYRSPVASAQVKSAVLLAGLFADGETSVTEPVLSRNHTELMVKGFGGNVRVEGTTATVSGRPSLVGQAITVPGDISSAAFWMVAALIVPGSEVLLQNVGINPTRTGILNALKAMGADISLENTREVTGEPVADIVVRSSQLKGANIGGEIIPRLIDEIPVLAVAAAAASGDTIISGAEELRVKETDRIAAIAQELSKFGAKIDETPGGMIIHGGVDLIGAECNSHGDHRIAMSCAIAGLIASGETTVQGAECIAISYPGFEEQLGRFANIS